MFLLLFVTKKLVKARGQSLSNQSLASEESNYVLLKEAYGYLNCTYI
jgi:hypothetical protein